MSDAATDVMNPATSDDYDIVIAGGGIVGAALALLLVRVAGFAPQRIVVLEREPARDWRADAPPDLRVVALSQASVRILTAAGAWSLIAAARISPYERMHVWHAGTAPHSPAALHFDAGDAAEPALGVIVENALIQTMLQRQLQAQGIALRQLTLDAVVFGADTLQLTAGNSRLRAHLLIGADGARSAVRRAAGLWIDDEDYGQTAVVANVRSALAHDSTAWQRFLGDGTLALLPLASGECSIVWSVPTTRAQHLLALPAQEFSAAVTADSDAVLGDLRLASGRAGFPLHRMSAPHYVLERCALVGDAAHVVHPLAGQGVNLGLLDAAALADVLGGGLREREDPGALRLLRAYERWRKSDNALMSRAFDAFNRHLSTGSDPLSRLLQRGLGVVGRSATLRHWFMRQAAGKAGELPSAARPRAANQYSPMER